MDWKLTEDRKKALEADAQKLIEIVQKENVTFDEVQTVVDQIDIDFNTLKHQEDE